MTSHASAFRLPAHVSSAPDEPYRHGDQNYEDSGPDERREDFYYPPPAAERPPKGDQTRVPDAASKDRVAEESPAHRHALQAGRHRDERADARYQVSDQDRLSPVALEYRTRRLQVGHEQQLRTFEMLDHTPQACLLEPEPDRIQHERGAHPRRRRREQHGHERQTAVADQEPEQRQRQLRRDRKIQTTRQYQDEHAHVLQRMDYVDDPPYEIGEHTTHLALSSYLQNNLIMYHAMHHETQDTHSTRAA